MKDRPIDYIYRCPEKGCHRALQLRNIDVNSAEDDMITVMECPVPGHYTSKPLRIRLLDSGRPSYFGRRIDTGGLKFLPCPRCHLRVNVVFLLERGQIRSWVQLKCSSSKCEWSSQAFLVDNQVLEP